MLGSGDKNYFSSLALLTKGIHKSLGTGLEEYISSLINLDIFLYNSVAVVCLLIYGNLLNVLKTATSCGLVILIRAMIVFEIISFISTILVQKVSFTIGSFDYFTMCTYDYIPGFLLFIFEKILRAQDAFFWALNGTILVYRMGFLTTSRQRIQTLFYIYLLPITIFLILLFGTNATIHIEYFMIAVMLFSWTVNKKLMVVQQYTAGLSSDEINNNKKLNRLNSIQMFFTLLFYFFKFGTYFAIQTSITKEQDSVYFVFFQEKIFYFIASFCSIINAVLFSWATSSFSKQTITQNIPLPVTTATPFSRRPSAISAYSFTGSSSPIPPPLSARVNPNFLHI